MKKLIIFAALLIVGSVPAALTADDDSHNNSHNFSARLSGFNEVHFSGWAARHTSSAQSQPGPEGKFRAKLHEHKDVIEYELSYEGLRGAVTQAHIHFGQRHTVGGIVVWLCETAARPAPPAVAALTPLCPAEGTVTGTITPGQILVQTAQGFEGPFWRFRRARSRDPRGRDLRKRSLESFHPRRNPRSDLNSSRRDNDDPSTNTFLLAAMISDIVQRARSAKL